MASIEGRLPETVKQELHLLMRAEDENDLFSVADKMIVYYEKVNREQYDRLLKYVMKYGTEI